MGDGILDGYPIIQDQTSPNLAHIPTTNLITYSEDFTQWSKTGTTDVSPNDNISPDGTQNASTVSGLTGSGSNDLYLIVGGNPASKTYSFSVYLKGSGTLRLQISNNVDQGINEIVTLTSDWKRHIVTGAFNSTSGNLSATLDDNGATATQYNIWGAQLEEQHQATAYIKSDGIAAVRKSSTTNLVNYSEDFTQSNWAKTNVDVSNNTELAPNNTLTATRTIINATGTDLRTQCDVIASSNYTWSFYAKKGTSTDITYRVYDVSNGSNIVSPTNYYSQLSTDWERVSLNFTTPSGCTSVLVYLTSDSVEIGDVYLWGAQLEEQTQAETYAKTTGLPVTIDLFTENNYGTMTNMSPSDIVEDTPNN
jgi:hypothetical protein